MRYHPRSLRSAAARDRAGAPETRRPARTCSFGLEPGQWLSKNTRELDQRSSCGQTDERSRTSSSTAELRGERRRGEGGRRGPGRTDCRHIRHHDSPERIGEAVGRARKRPQSARERRKSSLPRGASPQAAEAWEADGRHVDIGQDEIDLVALDVADRELRFSGHGPSSTSSSLRRVRGRRGRPGGGALRFGGW